jgi:hypothetical protein
VGSDESVSPVNGRGVYGFQSNSMFYRQTPVNGRIVDLMCVDVPNKVSL